MAENYFEILEKKVKEHPHKDAVVSYDIDLKKTSLTFQQLWTLGSKCAAILRKQGLKRHDKVLITVPNSLEYWVANFGIMMAGGFPIPMAKLSEKGEELYETTIFCETPMVFCTPSIVDPTWELMKPHTRETPSTAETHGLITSIVTSDMPHVKLAFLIKRSTGDQKGFLDYLDTCIDQYVDYETKSSDSLCSTVSLNLEKTMTPKIVEHSHRSIHAIAKSWSALLPGCDQFTISYPWYIGVALPYDTLCGKTRVQADTLDGHSNDEILVKMYHAGLLTNTILTTAMALNILNSIKDDEYNKIENCIVTGGMMTPATIENSRKICKNLFVSYAASEMLYVTMQKLDRKQTFEHYYAGKPRDGFQIKIVDNDFKEVPQGKPGQLLMKTDAAFSRYTGEHELTHKIKLKDGWFCLKDAGYIRADGHLFVFGRQGDIVSRGVFMIPVGLLERPIKTHPDVIEVKVIPVPDEINGQNTCACVVLRPGSQLTTKQLSDFVADCMSEIVKEWYILDCMVPIEQTLDGKTKQELIHVACKKLGITYKE